MHTSKKHTHRHGNSQTRPYTSSPLVAVNHNLFLPSDWCAWSICLWRYSVTLIYSLSVWDKEMEEGGGWNQTLLQRISTVKRVGQMDTHWLRKGEEGRYGNKTIQSLNKGAASQGRLQAELRCHRFNIYHTRKIPAHTQRHILTHFSTSGAVRVSVVYLWWIYEIWSRAGPGSPEQ